jgi:SAM-dependent methyltransferase
LRAEDLGSAEPRFPLRLAVCHNCWLLQIVDLVPPVELFTDYLYFSSFSEAMLRHARDAADRYRSEFHLGTDSLVVEVASNDGYLLKNFVAHGVPALGIEPAANVAEVARQNGVDTEVAFFTESLAENLAEEGRKADLILGNNVFAHAPETNDFVAGLSQLLKENGRIVLEFPYGGDFIEKCEFDTIYHEHVFYFFLTPLLPLFARHGLEIFRVERLPIHGGSLRLFAAHAGSYPIEPSVTAMRDDEARHGATRAEFYETFSDRVHGVREDLLRLLQQLRSEGRTIAAYGASAKGSTLLNFVKPPEGSIDFIVDRSTYKQGRYSPGLHLPIAAANQLVERQPDYTLLLTWNFAEEILQQQAEYRARGGKFIVPIPAVSVI